MKEKETSDSNYEFYDVNTTFSELINTDWHKIQS